MLFITALVLGGCQTVASVVEKKTIIDFEISEEVNPDLEDRPSPVVVRLYELSARTRFDRQDFFALYDDSKKALGEDLIKSTEYEFLPGSKTKHVLDLDADTRYVAAVVEFRQYEQARWKSIENIEQEQNNLLLVNVDRLSINLKRL